MKKIITAYIRSLVQRLAAKFEDAVTMTVSDLVSTIDKLETQIEKTIDKGINELADLAIMRDIVDSEISAQNADVDKAYKLLHKVSGLTK